MTIMNLESGTMSLMSCFHDNCDDYGEDNCDNGDEEEDVEEVYCKKGEIYAAPISFLPENQRYEGNNLYNLNMVCVKITLGGSESL